MHEHHSPNPGQEPAHPKVDFDRSEASLLGVAVALAAIALTFGVAATIASWFVRAHMPSDTNPSQNTYLMPAGPLPPEPRLESLDRNGFTRQLAMEHLLHSYGQTSEAFFVHIPIEEAMKLVISKLPAQPRTSPQTSKSYGLVEGGESNSGRLYQEAPSWFESAH